jgi:dimethylhistidine N-methyltransferase
MLNRNLIEQGGDRGGTAVPEPLPASREFARDLKRALESRPRSISPKYFYDRQGSALFDAICELPEYYPTRTELAILADNARDIASHMGDHAEVVEFGAGSLRKVRLLLDAMNRPAGYLPIDISGDHMARSAAGLQRDYPGLRVQPVVADYTQELRLPPLDAGRRIGFFPGSTIGNFTPEESLVFLERTVRLLRGGALLLGADLIKDPVVLHAAYNDAQGVTAAFNLNLLARANRELGTDFVLEQFAHSSFYNAPLQRIEMHLVSRCAQTVSLRGEPYEFEEGETLHTENSYKFTTQGLHRLAERAGFRPGPAWTDPQRLFCVQWLHAPE